GGGPQLVDQDQDLVRLAVNIQGVVLQIPRGGVERDEGADPVRIVRIDIDGGGLCEGRQGNRTREHHCKVETTHVSHPFPALPEAGHWRPAREVVVETLRRSWTGIRTATCQKRLWRS